MRRSVACWIALAGVLCAFLVPPAAHAAEVVVSGVRTDVNASGDPEIWVYLDLDMKADVEIDVLASSSLYADNRFPILLVGAEPEGTWLAPQFGSRFFALSAEDPNTTLGKAIVGRAEGLHIESSRDIQIVYTDGTRQVLTRAQIKKHSSRIALGADGLAALEDVAQGRQRIYEDRLDFAREIDEQDSTLVDYAVSFRFSQPIRTLPLRLETQGRLSTNEENPLNQVEASLVSRMDVKGVSSVFYSFFLDAGVIALQSGDVSAVRGAAGLDLLLPNFLDLTGGANRLRMKPVVSVSGGYRQASKDVAAFGGDEKGSVEARFEIGYTIPILTKYVLDVHSDAVYAGKAEGDKWFHQTSATLAYDLPLEELKVIAKWEIGRNEFTTEQDSKVLLGLLADFLPF